MMSRKQLLIPFDKDGSIPWEHPWGLYNGDLGDFELNANYRWELPEPFKARLRLDQIIVIRSGATVRMMNEDTGARYAMKVAEFARIVPFMCYGVTPVMPWQAFKTGNNYNIRWANPDAPKKGSSHVRS